jgi:hypothetical protein
MHFRKSFVGIASSQAYTSPYFPTPLMKKFSLLLGTLGGAMAGYLLSNEKLRDDLAKAKDPEAAAKLLGAHLAKDGKKIGKEVQGFVASDQVKQNVRQFKSYATDKWTEAQKGLEVMMKKGAKSAKSMVKGKKAPAAKKEAKGAKPKMKQSNV